MIWAQLVYALVMMVVSYAISYYTTRRAKPQDTQVGNFDVTTAEAGKTIPVIFGTILIKDSNVIDYFDAKTDEIKS